MGIVGEVFGDVVDGITGQTAADAAKRSGYQQADQFNKIYDLYKPVADAGRAQLEPLSAGATAAGYGQNIGDILNSGALQPMIQDRQNAATSYMAAHGLRRSGAAVREAANIPSDLAMQIENELNRRRQSIAGIGQTGNAGASGALEGIGSSLAGGTLGQAQAQSQGIGNILQLGGMAAASLSDARLKEDVVQVGNMGGLAVVDWNWNQLAADKFGLKGRSSGFIAQDVMDLYPHHVRQKGGFLAIDYDGLLSEINHAH